MTTAELRSDHLLPPAWKPSQEVGWWAMALVCMSEAALFAYFLVGYFYLGVENPAWPPAGIEKRLGGGIVLAREVMQAHAA